MKILIVEDEQNAAKRLIGLIQKNINNADIITVLDSIETSINWFKANTHPNLIFLDIQLSDGLCFNIFKQIEVNSPIIFTTAYDEFSLKAFELNSIDYLLKPINEEKLKLALKKYNKLSTEYSNKINSKEILKLLSAKKPSKTRFLVNKGNSLQIVDINDIAYFYSKDKNVIIATNNNNEYLIKDSLENVENDIEQGLMFRINRQLLISIKSIDKIHNYFNYKLKIELKPQTKFDAVVSRSKVSNFKHWIAKG